MTNQLDFSVKFGNEKLNPNFYLNLHSWLTWGTEQSLGFIHGFIILIVRRALKNKSFFPACYTWQHTWACSCFRKSLSTSNLLCSCWMFSWYSCITWSLSLWSKSYLQGASKQNMEIPFIFWHFTCSGSIPRSLHICHVLLSQNELLINNGKVRHSSRWSFGSL